MAFFEFQYKSVDISHEYILYFCLLRLLLKFILKQMAVLALCLRTFDGVDCPPIDMSVILSACLSAHITE